MRRVLLSFVVMVALSRAAGAQTLAQSVLASYNSVQSVSCEVRRDTKAEGGASMRTLSRVCFQRPDRLHVENFTPVKRRIVADGATFFSYIEGDPKGFSRPVANLDEEMLIQLRKIPGTAMDHLMKIRDTAETDLPATEEFPVRRGYDMSKLFVVLSVDATGRLARIEFFDSAGMKNKTAQYDYSAFQQAADGAWIPCLHQGSLWFGGVETRETTRIDNLAVNQPVQPNLFVAAPFFKGVKFVDDFGLIYE
ncbi:MAG: hypothetical protein KJ726_00385 [Verrucomicrobia bacterium]|nr:hypothetical protein [Verrucomicrobiota bacterium]MBU1908487.1 hypothetical protein [Verrucomicrobiota bacterium]